MLSLCDVPGGQTICLHNVFPQSKSVSLRPKLPVFLCSISTFENLTRGSLSYYNQSLHGPISSDRLLSLHCLHVANQQSRPAFPQMPLDLIKAIIRDVLPTVTRRIRVSLSFVFFHKESVNPKPRPGSVVSITSDVSVPSVRSPGYGLPPTGSLVHGGEVVRVACRVGPSERRHHLFPRVPQNL